MRAPRALPHPWSLWDPDADPTDGDTAPTLDARGAFLLAVDPTTPLRTNHPRTRVTPGRTRSDRHGTSWIVHDLGAPSDAATGADLIVGEDTALSIALQGIVPRPDATHDASPAAVRLDALVGLQVERLERAIDDGRKRIRETGVMRGVVRPTWPDLADAILTPEDPSEPTMALIVRHAETMRRAVRDVADRPRRILRRNRERERVDRIREMDVGSLRHYARQPGVTPAEKAGRDQRLMAVVRRETHDTLENRVLKDFLRRSTNEARTYLRAHANHGASSRYRQVRTYRTLVRRYHASPDLEDVGTLRTVPTPNYVLLHDRRYHAIWTAYLELVRREDVLDEAWTWQRRLWSDVASLMLLAAPAAPAGPADAMYVHTGNLPYLRTEQAQGRWTDTERLERVFLPDEQADVAYVVRRVDPDVDDATDTAPLATDVEIEAFHLPTGRRRRGVAWAVHGVAEDAPDLGALAHSADRAVETWNAANRAPIDRALVLTADGDPDADATATRVGRTTALEVPLAGAAQTDALHAIHAWIRALGEEVAG